jgi:hypothetical protein
MGVILSVFTNSISDAGAHATSYTAAVLNLLGDKEPLGVLENLVSTLEKSVAGLSEDQLRQAEKPGKWSIIEVIQHLADSELVWAYRLKMVIAEDRPSIRGYDQDSWATRLGYRNSNLDDSMEQFRILRKMNLRLINSLSGDDLERVGVHSERGDESVVAMIRLYAGHDLVHLNQISRIRESL